MKDNAIIWCLVASFVAGALVGFVAVATMHRHYHEVIKTSIGEFIIHDGKIYSVYEMERNVRGEMVTK
jgi:hypothetical protein